LRTIITSNLPRGYVESMRHGMITYKIPLKTFADTYNKEPLQYIGLAAQKHFVALYLMGLYLSKKSRSAFISAWKESGHKLRMGKSCVRIESLDAAPLELIGKTVASIKPAEFVMLYKKVKKQPEKS